MVILFRCICSFVRCVLVFFIFYDQQKRYSFESSLNSSQCTLIQSCHEYTGKDIHEVRDELEVTKHECGIEISADTAMTKVCFRDKFMLKITVSVSMGPG